MYGLWWWASPNKAPNSSKKVEEEEGISVVSHVHPKALAHHHLEVQQVWDLFWMMMKPAMRPSGHTFHPLWSWSSLHTEQPHKDSWASFGSLNFRAILFFTTYHEMRRENYWISDRLKKTFSRYILWQEDDISSWANRGRRKLLFILHWPLRCLVPFPSYSNKSVEKHLTFISTDFPIGPSHRYNHCTVG